MKKRRPFKEKKRSIPMMILKAALLGCVAAVVLVLLLAALLEKEFLSMEALGTLTMIVKGICGVLVGWIVKRSMSHKLLLVLCGLGGGVYMLLSFLCFALAERTLSFSWAMLGDIALGFAFGVLGGVLAGFARK
ncbi:MAG: hypothetical protein PHO41_04580 [Eubacteriales bacterium]|nr:hypothetical protein [Eubacteriales bacterium]